MSMTKGDKEYFSGYYDGYKSAIDDMRQELLTLQADTKAPVSIEIFEILNFMADKVRSK